ncbi:shikimate kinase AroK [Agaribacterium sp. ZY112]|uniref:shikimate kinase AroK n=1 Tax=Agaribacterium sp. ZY112 TaxID=3233574 RepID=UPI0035245EFD
MKARTVLLVGPMGAGKSTIGRLLAAKLSYEFLDTDHVIEDKTGADIAWIFDVEGEQGFRERENQCLAELVSRPQTVLATGGGIVCREDNRALISAADVVVYLKASVEQLLARTAKDKKRPLLQVDDPRAKIVSLLEERAPLYESVADYSVDTDGSGPRATVQAILKLLQA